jgi:hypothetical protein
MPVVDGEVEGFVVEAADAHVCECSVRGAKSSDLLHHERRIGDQLDGHFHGGWLGLLHRLLDRIGEDEHDIPHALIPEQVGCCQDHDDRAENHHLDQLVTDVIVFISQPCESEGSHRDSSSDDQDPEENGDRHVSVRPCQRDTFDTH